MFSPDGNISIDRRKFDDIIRSFSQRLEKLERTGLQEVSILNAPTVSASDPEDIETISEEFVFQNPVLDIIDFTSAEPGAPSDGDRYINSGTGASSGTAQSVTADYIYTWDGSIYIESVTVKGYTVFVMDEDKYYTFVAAWVLLDSLLSIFGEVNITKTATEDDDHALEIDIDAAGFGGVKGVDITYTTGAIPATSEEAALLIQFIQTAAIGGQLVGLEVLSVEGAATVYAMKTSAGVKVIEQHSGTFEDADEVDDNGATITTLNSGGAGNVAVFTNNSEYMIIGHASKFEEIQFIVDTGASGAGIKPTFEYSTGVGAWAPFEPEDGTNQMRNSGLVIWDDAELAGWLAGAGAEFLIRITRTRVTLTTTPILDLIQIASVTLYSWDELGNVILNSLKLAGTLKNQASNEGLYTGPSDQLRMYFDSVSGVVSSSTNLILISGSGGNDIFLRTADKVLIQDTEDTNVSLFDLDGTNRTLGIGLPADPMVLTNNGDVNIAAGSFIMDGSGTDDEALQLPYLTAAPATLANGMMWMESDGQHLYYNNAEKIVAGV